MQSLFDDSHLLLHNFHPIPSNLISLRHVVNPSFTESAMSLKLFLKLLFGHLTNSSRSLWTSLCRRHFISSAGASTIAFLLVFFWDLLLSSFKTIFVFYVFTALTSFFTMGLVPVTSHQSMVHFHLGFALNMILIMLYAARSSTSMSYCGNISPKLITLVRSK